MVDRWKADKTGELTALKGRVYGRHHIQNLLCDYYIYCGLRHYCNFQTTYGTNAMTIYQHSDTRTLSKNKERFIRFNSLTLESER